MNDLAQQTHERLMRQFILPTCNSVCSDDGRVDYAVDGAFSTSGLRLPHSTVFTVWWDTPRDQQWVLGSLP